MKLACVDATIGELDLLTKELTNAECSIERTGDVVWLHINWLDLNTVEFVKY